MEYSTAVRVTATANKNARLWVLAVMASVFVFALLVRAWVSTWITDFWGDSYHHWLITRLTLQNGVYSDFKGLEVVWTPLYHYVSMVPLLLTGRGDIEPLHWMNILLGALTCALVARLAWRLYANYLAAFTAGALLALMTWHIAFSAMNVAEIFSGLLLVAATLAVLDRPSGLGVLAGYSARARTWTLSRIAHYALLLLLALAMPLTRTDLSVYLGIIVIWLAAQRRYGEAGILVGGMVAALGGWSAWSWVKTGNPLFWYQQYAHNNLHDWQQLNNARTRWTDFALYLARLSPLVLPALLTGILGILSNPRGLASQPDSSASDLGARRRNLWLVTALLAGHTLFLIVGYGRGLVPLLTERYLVLDLPLTAALAAGWVWLAGNWAWEREGRKPGRSASACAVVAGVLLAIVLLRFENDLPELEIRRWGIDEEWQLGNFISKEVQPGEIVLTDAPVAIYRSGKPLDQFISSVALARYGTGTAALRAAHVRWIVVQPASYDAASSYLPPERLQRQSPGVSGGLRFELAWRYDPSRNDIQSEIWHVIDSTAPDSE